MGEKAHENGVNLSENSQNSVNLMAESVENSQIFQNDNFANAKSTHPQTPSAREGALNSANSTTQGEGALPLENADFPFALPRSWAWVRLGDIVEIISGTSYAKSDLTTAQNGIRILRGGNINKDFRTLDLKGDDVFVTKNLQSGEKNVKRGDVVITGTNDLANIAKCAFADSDLALTQIGAFLRLVRTSEPFSAKYVFYILSSDDYEKYLKFCVSGTVSTLLNVKNEYIENYLIPLPPLKEQEFIAQSLERLFAISKGLKGE